MTSSARWCKDRGARTALLSAGGACAGAGDGSAFGGVRQIPPESGEWWLGAPGLRSCACPVPRRKPFAADHALDTRSSLPDRGAPAAPGLLQRPAAQGPRLLSWWQLRRAGWQDLGLFHTAEMARGFRSCYSPRGDVVGCGAPAALTWADALWGWCRWVVGEWCRKSLWVPGSPSTALGELGARQVSRKAARTSSFSSAALQPAALALQDLRGQAGGEGGTGWGGAFSSAGSPLCFRIWVKVTALMYFAGKVQCSQRVWVCVYTRVCTSLTAPTRVCSQMGVHWKMLTGEQASLRLHAGGGSRGSGEGFLRVSAL